MGWAYEKGLEEKRGAVEKEKRPKKTQPLNSLLQHLVDKTMG